MDLSTNHPSIIVTQIIKEEHLKESIKVSYLKDKQVTGKQLILRSS